MYFQLTVYKQTLVKNNIIQSYSKKGYPYDNAWIESFHKSIKQEKLKTSISEMIMKHIIYVVNTY